VLLEIWIEIKLIILEWEIVSMIIYSDSKLQSGKSYGSLFAGVGGFDLGFETAGFDCMWQVEWDKYCQQVLEFHWPSVPKFGDIRDVSGYDLEPVDVISYGFPCQDLSTAGKQTGLDGDRSSLFFEAIRIIKEMRDATDGKFPKAVIAENVTGLLTADKGTAMGRCLDALAEAGALVSEWCVLDAQWFGVPQKRRRVFLASIFDTSVAGRCANEIFPVAKSGSRNPAEVEQERQEVARTASDSVGECGLQRVTGTLAAGAHPVSYNGQDAYSDMLIAFSHTQGLDPQPSQHHFPTLRSGGGGQAVAQPNLAVRRLTPVECERLMGWPDDHTLKRADGKTTSDSQRFKMCGNGVVAPVAEWVAKQIMVLL